MHERLRARTRRVEREPETPEPAEGRPPRCRPAVPRGKMLRKPGEQHIPALITGRARRIFKQSRTSLRRLLLVLLEELNDQPPFRVKVWLGSDEPSKIGKSHRLVAHIHSVTNVEYAVSRRRRGSSCVFRDLSCGQPAGGLTAR